MTIKLSVLKTSKQDIKEFLTEKTISKNPFTQFKKWFDEASHSKFIHSNAMTLATSSKKGKPSARIVLLKSFDESGFVFFTNYKSKKGKDLKENPFASLLFYWDVLEKQIRIEGKISKLSREESEAYFSTRPYNSRIGAWASEQSSMIKGRNILEKDFEKYLTKFKTDVPLPQYWGGYKLKPNYFEFWQGRQNRLHDRICYSKQKKDWKIERLAP